MAVIATSVPLVPMVPSFNTLEMVYTLRGEIMTNEVRPRLPKQLKEEVENIYQVARQEQAESFQTALELTCTLAYEAIEQDLHEAITDQESVPSLPEEWRRLDDSLLRIIDDELPGTWKQSRLVAERVQKVIKEFLQVRWNNGTLVYTTSFAEGDELTTRDAIKEAFERARRDGDSTVSLSAVRSTCHTRLYPNARSPAGEFEDALTAIQDRAESEEYTSEQMSSNTA